MEFPSPSSPTTLAESQHKATHKQTVKTGRGWILAVSILQLLSATLVFVASRNVGEAAAARALLITSVVVAVLGLIFLGLWIWAKRAPFAAAVSALALYVSFIALDAVIDPSQLVRGIILKILIIVGLSQAVKSSYALKKAAEDNG